MFAANSKYVNEEICELTSADAAGNMWTINNEDSFVTVLVNIVEHDESEIVLSYSLKTTWAVDGELDNSIITIFNLSVCFG